MGKKIRGKKNRKEERKRGKKKRKEKEERKRGKKKRKINAKLGRIMANLIRSKKNTKFNEVF
jgi:hypothetical protein